MRQLFVEVNPYHSVTLFPYHGMLSKNAADVVLAHKRLFGQPLFDRIAADKQPVSFGALWRLLRRGPIEACRFSTIKATLTPITRETVGLAFQTALLALTSRSFGCRVTAIVHEADQFFATGLDSCRRHAWFRRLIGRWFIKLFDERYVLSPEVLQFLHER